MIISRVLVTRHYWTTISAASILVATLLPSGALAAAEAQEAPQRPLDPMAEQMAKLSGAMHAATKVCGGYTEEKLAESKKQLQQMLGQRGMDQVSFERAYSAAMQETASRWQTLSQSEQKEACADLKQQAAQMVP